MSACRHRGKQLKINKLNLNGSPLSGHFGVKNDNNFIDIEVKSGRLKGFLRNGVKDGAAWNGHD